MLKKVENHYQLNRDTIALHNLSPCGYDLSPMKRGMKLSPMKRGMKRGYEADFNKVSFKYNISSKKKGDFCLSRFS